MAPEASKESVLREVRKVHREWPTFLSDSIPKVEKAALELPDDARQAGLQMAPLFVRNCKERKNNVCSFAVYLRERRWERLTDIGIAAEPKRPEAYTRFSRAGHALRLYELVQPIGHLPTMPAALQLVCEAGEHPDATDAERKMSVKIRSDHRKRWGWPAVNAMAGKSRILVPDWLLKISETFATIDAGSHALSGWMELFERRSWPWFPDNMERYFFPAGNDPEQALYDFMDAISMERSDDDAA
ncbi:hypothetical protein [Neorhizobium alkalisoli]|uniref:Uncharacterized protein n=1 Tax=Neorhizobium alkalisoli TaxID=528178 RepID=A0A561QS87_9HYPH|nr:hypothetical protein [Neorhizobium alkalisoli]TWF53250.1 hypothetical protein FHW37_104527 [Neorhizobium alkalisoli]